MMNDEAAGRVHPDEHVTRETEVASRERLELTPERFDALMEEIRAVRRVNTEILRHIERSEDRQHSIERRSRFAAVDG